MPPVYASTTITPDFLRGDGDQTQVFMLLQSAIFKPNNYFKFYYTVTITEQNHFLKPYKPP